MRNFILLAICAALCGCDTTGSYNPADNGGPPKVEPGALIYVPEGEFTMGSPVGSFDNNEHPQHTVSLSGYAIGAYEVTNLEYAEFLNDEAGVDHWDYRMEITRAGTRFLAREESKNLPVSYVTWEDADAYCRWRGGRLPTEAEWEKAARGPEDKRIFPWGDQITTGAANFANGIGGLWEVGTALGRSYYGCYDMAGNVWEWVADWYDEHYYSNSPLTNPPGPARTDVKVLRGGSFMNNEYAVRCSKRWDSLPDARFVYLGFRCAKDSL